MLKLAQARERRDLSKPTISSALKAKALLDSKANQNQSVSPKPQEVTEISGGRKVPHPPPVPLGPTTKLNEELRLRGILNPGNKHMKG